MTPCQFPLLQLEASKGALQFKAGNQTERETLIQEKNHRERHVMHGLATVTCTHFEANHSKHSGLASK